MGTTTVGAIQPKAAVADVKAKSATRLLFIDNIRVFLTILVILQHLMVTYAATGSWFYQEGRQDFITVALGQWFCAVNQAFFMGFFFLIAAYFVPGSYDRKGPGRFAKDRLIRLGIPLIIFSWVVEPLMNYMLQVWQNGPRPFTMGDLVGHFFGGTIIGGGPLWFVEALLIFSFVYVLWRLATRNRPAKPVAESSFPSNGAVLLLAVVMTAATFLARLVFRVDDYNFVPLNLQLPFFAQYIILFIVGLVAYRRNWLLGLPDKTGRLWLGIAIFLILIWLPLVLVGGGVDDASTFKGGWYWQSVVYPFWESIFSLSMIIGLTYAFRRYLNTRGKVAGFLAPNAYTAYIIHAPIIVIISLSIRDAGLHPLLKFALVALVSVPLIFWVSSLIRKLPYADRVL